ncbi:hypothetical protein [Fodinibius salsisoli]|uniref:FixH protein n=1 Tax=Fodinibius salsisoli TaxID=2820877 RepID=A0ABT3PSJ7_9BACT|nr:hypothetical protein [Fodinibius salsisoli]MCW9708837.1 hypothetical protein [Fodinibius salsisoli]
MNWELIISGAAFVVSLGVAIYSYLQGRKSNDLQEEQTKLQRRVVEIEEQREQERLAKENRADLQPYFRYISRKDSPVKIARQITIENLGKHEAQNIRMYVDGDPVSMHRDIFCRPDNKLSPIQPDSDQMWCIEVDEESPEVCEIMLKWDDETGSDYEFKDKLPLKK